MLCSITLWMVAAQAVFTAAGATSAARASLIRGVSYGPVPLKSIDGASSLPADDWFCDEATAMWGPAGRRDLRVMRQMGANMVRLYGNNPANDHTNFLDEAWQEGLSVAPGMSDYPYYQMVPGSCLQETDFNCFSQVKPLYLQNLHNGFLTMDKKYHPALKYMNILNEPDLKMPSTTDTGGPDGPKQMARALISAFDAMLEAEKEAGVTGPLINFTATFSYAICGACGGFTGKPALGQMWTLDDAMRHPEKYDYTPLNDITAAYEQRFTHSFNTQNPATDLQHQFLDDYSAHFPTTPVYIGEYHRVHANQTQDLDLILGLAEANELFLGISFFQYQVAYWKTGSEMDFGMFGLGDTVLASMPYFGATYNVYCLTPQASPESGMSMPDAVALTYGGSNVESLDLCAKNPLAMSLDQAGFEEVLAENSASQMALFVERVINHMGATVPAENTQSLNTLAQSIVGGEYTDYSMVEMASYLGSRPDWVKFDTQAKCVADRAVDPSVIGSAIGWTCSQAKSFTCEEVWSWCQNNTYRIADFVFSRYYDELTSDNPLVDCDFSGAAIFASSELYGGWTGSAQCVSGAATQTTTSTVPPATTVTTGAAATSAAASSTESPAAATTAATTAAPPAGEQESTTTTLRGSSGHHESTNEGGDDNEQTSSALRPAALQQAAVLLALVLPALALLG